MTLLAEVVMTRRHDEWYFSDDGRYCLHLPTLVAKDFHSPEVITVAIKTVEPLTSRQATGDPNS